MCVLWNQTKPWPRLAHATAVVPVALCCFTNPASVSTKIAFLGLFYASQGAAKVKTSKYPKKALAGQFMD